MTPESTPRTSIASLAVIRQIDSAGVVRYLAQWNPKWQAYNSVGGHKRDSESFRACLVREVAEELGVFPPADDLDAAAMPAPEGKVPRCRVGALPLGMLEYEAFSRSANVLTRYAIALFEVELSSWAVDRISATEGNAWLSEQEIDAGQSADGRTVSETMRRHLDWLRGGAPAPIPVYWLIAPENRLREAMSEEAATADGESRFRTECDFVGNHLRRMFPRVRAIIIRDRLEGFRRLSRPHKLLVELVSSPEDDDRSALAPGVWGCREVHLVKIGDPEKLEEEWRGWRACQPPGSDSILSSLCAVRHGGRLVGLIYGDATNAIGGAALSLEQAVRDCCRFDTPSRESIVFTLRRLYGRLNDRLYRRSFVPEVGQHFAVDPPGPRSIRPAPVRAKDTRQITLLRHRVEEAIAFMKDGGGPRPGESPPNLSDRERQRLRREALARLAGGDVPTFLDPLDHLALARDHPELVPAMLVGASHGDLHGRNVIVGKMVDEVGSVAVFDYGDMHLANHVGWDFVKMETELKVRAYAELFPAERGAYFHAVHSFEFRLAARTENVHHSRGKVEDDAETDLRHERLARILLEIRRLAGLCLGHDRHRPHAWLEEYYFLLVCYGAYAMRFPTYGTPHFLAAYASAGTAACRLSYPWNWLRHSIAQAGADAKRLAEESPDADAAALCVAAEDTPTFKGLESKLGHHARLSFLRVWAQMDAEKGEFLKAAACLLGGLCAGYAHALEVGEVLLLVLLRQGDVIAAKAALADLYRRHVDLPFEIECRFGRILRDEGVKAWSADQPRPTGWAADQLAESLRVYQRAWLQSQHYYPGGNVAGLHLLLGRKEAAQTVAAKVLAAAREAPATDLWARIAQADMLYILDDDKEAARLYEDAHPRSTPLNLESSLRQLNLLLRVEPDRRKVWDRTRLIELFGVEAVGKICPLPGEAKKE